MSHIVPQCAIIVVLLLLYSPYSEPLLLPYSMLRHSIYLSPSVSAHAVYSSSLSLLMLVS